MDKIYKRAEDKYVATNVIYYAADGVGSGLDPYAYSDYNCTKKLSADELRNAFNNGCVAASIELNGPDILRDYVKITRIGHPDMASCDVSFLEMANGTVKEIRLYSSEYVPSP